MLNARVFADLGVPDRRLRNLVSAVTDLRRPAGTFVLLSGERSQPAVGPRLHQHVKARGDPSAPPAVPQGPLPPAGQNCRRPRQLRRLRAGRSRPLTASPRRQRRPHDSALHVPRVPGPRSPSRCTDDRPCPTPPLRRPAGPASRRGSRPPAGPLRRAFRRPWRLAGLRRAALAPSQRVTCLTVNSAKARAQGTHSWPAASSVADPSTRGPGAVA